MNIKVENKIPGIKVSLNKNADGSMAILLVEEKSDTVKKNGAVPVGKVAPGTVVKIADRKYIVLGHGSDTTAMITKDIVYKCKYMGSGYYEKSYVRTWLNTPFYLELCSAVGSENIVEHKVNLMAEDGTGKGFCKDKVSLITIDNYRRYREYIKRVDDPFWTANRITYNRSIVPESNFISVIDGNGIFGWRNYEENYGVRPYFIVDSNVSVVVVND